MRRCLIADDHPLVRAALAAAIAISWPETEIIEAADFPSACTLAAAGADLCLVDLAMPGAGPVEGVTALRAAAPSTPILVITGSCDDATMVELIGRGVAGFEPKSLTVEVMSAAINLVLAGGRYLPPRLAELQIPTSLEAPSRLPQQTAFGPLSPRNLDVVRLMAQGLSNKDIARTLNISPATVKTHVAQVIALIGATNRTDASMRAQRLGLV